jgi:hypothetical protein
MSALLPANEKTVETLNIGHGFTVIIIVAAKSEISAKPSAVPGKRPPPRLATAIQGERAH